MKPLKRVWRSLYDLHEEAWATALDNTPQAIAEAQQGRSILVSAPQAKLDADRQIYLNRVLDSHHSQ